MEIQEKKNEYASKGIAGTGLGLGIAGTALALLNGGNLGGILGGGTATNCYEHCPVTQSEFTLEKEIAAKDSRIALLESTIYTDNKIDTKLMDFRNYVDAKFAVADGRLNAVDVYAATNNATIGCMQNSINQLYSLTKLIVPNDSVCPGWGTVTIK